MESLDPRLRTTDAGGATSQSEQVLAPNTAFSSQTPTSGSITAGAPSTSVGAGAGSSPGDPAGDTPHSHSSSADSPAGDDAGPNGGGGAAAGQPNGPPGEDPKKPRACEACRGLKVRCEPDPANPDGPCRRCERARRACIVTQPTRKRQKKTDSRVAELEKKIDALTASLHATRGSGGEAPETGMGDRPMGAPMPRGSLGLLGNVTGSQGGPGVYGVMEGYGRELGVFTQEPGRQQQAPSPYSQPYQPPMVMAGQKRKYAESRDASTDEGSSRATGASPATATASGGGAVGPAAAAVAAATPAPQSSSLGNAYSDIVDRGIITMEMATEFFSRYNEQMVPHLPGIVFPLGTSVSDVRKTKPILFLALMAASSSEVPNVQGILVRELMQLFAEKIVIIGEKSLEMVQALQLAVIWYRPPEHFEELKFYQLIHIAAVMAIDIGLGRKGYGKKRGNHSDMWRDHPFKKQPLPDPATMESRRTWLTCYFLAANTAMALHRPNLIRWNAFMSESMEVLQSSPDAAPTDRYLCHLVWTHKMAEEIGVQFSMDDPTAQVNVADPRLQYALKGFERDLEKYSRNIPKEDQRASLMMSFHILSLYMHEVALHGESGDKEVFKPPFVTDALSGVLVGDGALTPARISALSACLTAIDGIFETFLAMDIASVRSLPVFNFVRVAYATVVLMKMYFAASAPESELGKVINKDNLKVEVHLEALLDKFSATTADDRSRPASKFLMVLIMIRSWFQKQKAGSVPGAALGVERSSSSPGPGLGRCPTLGLPSFASSPRAGGADGPEAPGASNGGRAGSTALGPTPTTQQMPQPPQDSLSTANTPLQLLSEVATHNSGAGPARPGTAGVGATAVPWFQTPQPPQPFMYDSGDGSAVPAPTATTGATPDLVAAGANLPMMPFLNMAFNTDFDYASLGDGFTHAMDMTLAGFEGGSMLPFPGSTGIGDGWYTPWMEGMPGGAASFRFKG